MRILGHGIDLIETTRIAQMVEKHGDRFLQRVFTVPEVAHGQGKKREAEHLAGRFAAKEAVLKALGTGWAEGVGWRDIEVVALPSGAPSLRLSGHAAKLAQDKGITAWHLSISHTDSHAMASVIAEGE
jgi:holo-[acyl-carrier protein] synthase